MVDLKRVRSRSFCRLLWRRNSTRNVYRFPQILTLTKSQLYTRFLQAQELARNDLKTQFQSLGLFTYTMILEIHKMTISTNKWTKYKVTSWDVQTILLLQIFTANDSLLSWTSWLSPTILTSLILKVAPLSWQMTLPPRVTLCSRYGPVNRDLWWLRCPS